MTRTHDIADRHWPSRVASLAALLLTSVTAAASFALAVPDLASADESDCPRGQFCIFEHANEEGGMYGFGGSNMSLSNYFFRGTRRVVANEGSSLVNNGTVGKLDDVVVYMGVDDDVDLKRTPSFCVRQGKAVDNLDGTSAHARSFLSWNDSIVGYRWVTNRECRAAGRR